MDIIDKIPDHINELYDFTKPLVTDIAVAVAGSVDSGKCFAPDTLVLTSIGLKSIQDICVGDLVIGDDCKHTIVTHVHSGYSSMYSIHTSDGKKYVVTDNHILCLVSTSKEKMTINTTNFWAEVETGQILEIPVSKYIDLFVDIQQHLKWYRHIPISPSEYKRECVSFIVKKEDGEKYHGFTIGGNGRFLLDDYSVVHNSSFVGVLSGDGELDDGNGKARCWVAKHPHEKITGKTSAISTKICKLKTVNRGITLVDLCGHENYLKTTTHGISGYFPDYAFLVIGPNRGIVDMTKQHLRLITSLSIPIIIIVSHIDSNNIENAYATTIESITALFNKAKLKTTFVNGINDINKSEEELLPIKNNAIKTILSSITNIPDGKQTIYPIVSISNVTGFFLDVVKNVLEKLTPRDFWIQDEKNVAFENKHFKSFEINLQKSGLEMSKLVSPYKQFDGGVFYVDSSYTPPGIGLVITGINRGKTINLGDVLTIGPFGKTFYRARAKSFHNNAQQVILQQRNHYRGTIAIVPLDKAEIGKSNITKGIIALSNPDLIQNVCYRIKAVISIFNQSITLATGYSPVIHLHTIRQTARMIIDPAENNGKDVICFDGKTTNVAVVTFKFKIHPEFVERYNIFILRSGDIQGIGMILSTIPIDDDTDAKPDPHKHKKTHNIKNIQKSTKVPKK